jgi:hypothetical protein
MAQIVLKVFVRRVTGRVRYYPTGENAAHVFALIKKKTLSELELESLKALGVLITTVQEDLRPKKRWKLWG